MLHDVTAEGGVGFCHAAVPALLPAGYHGPLFLALDSNLLIDLQQYGHELLAESLAFQFGDWTVAAPSSGRGWFR